MKRNVNDTPKGKTAGQTKPAASRPTKVAAKEPRNSIFDTSYAPEGAEFRKAWSRLDRQK
ncbi:hypothetical protein ACX9MO_15285 [Pseudooceanicola sp. 502str34]|uniref:hypothetical protein n=1 Tax=Maritimibacter alkaliphilus TaxID=404236 RepID=UPI001C98CAB0|nr:hypothetical protein [Maritimibacter alkaliphilus]MBY6091770.1 hypothetical protein [Maritimibacter alkaliphilus]